MAKDTPQQHPSDRTTQHQAPHAAAERAENVHKQVNFGEVGNHDANHVWSKMTGPQAEHGEMHPHKSALEQHDGRTQLNMDVSDPYKTGADRAPRVATGNHDFAPPPSTGDISRTGAHERAAGDDRNRLGAGHTFTDGDVRGMGATDYQYGQVAGRPAETVAARDAIQSSTNESRESFKVGDHGKDFPTEANGLRPPSMFTPTPEQMANDPVDKLQKMVQDNRAALDGYMKRQGENIPNVVSHGTDKTGQETISNGLQSGRLIWGAGQDPARGAEKPDPGQRVGDIATGLGFSEPYSRGDRPGQKGRGAIYALDAGGDPKGWDRTPNLAKGDESKGTSEKDIAKFGEFESGKVKVVGEVKGAQLDGIAKQYGEIDKALIAKQQGQIAQPGGTTPGEIADINARAQVMRENRALVTTQAYLDSVIMHNTGNEM